MAEEVGFEPTVRFSRTAVFKTAALNHSTTPPACHSERSEGSVWEGGAPPHTHRSLATLGMTTTHHDREFLRNQCHVERDLHANLAMLTQLVGRERQRNGDLFDERIAGTSLGDRCAAAADVRQRVENPFREWNLDRRHRNVDLRRR